MRRVLWMFRRHSITLLRNYTKGCQIRTWLFLFLLSQRSKYLFIANNEKLGLRVKKYLPTKPNLVPVDHNNLGNRKSTKTTQAFHASFNVSNSKESPRFININTYHEVKACLRSFKPCLNLHEATAHCPYGAVFREGACLSCVQTPLFCFVLLFPVERSGYIVRGVMGSHRPYTSPWIHRKNTSFQLYWDKVCVNFSEERSF